MHTLVQKLWCLKDMSTVVITKIIKLGHFYCHRSPTSPRRKYKLRSTSYPVRTWRECQKLSMVVFKGTLISYRQKVTCAENQA